jgi:hypothetical protein
MNDQEPGMKPVKSESNELTELVGPCYKLGAYAEYVVKKNAPNYVLGVTTPGDEADCAAAILDDRTILKVTTEDGVNFLPVRQFMPEGAAATLMESVVRAFYSACEDRDETAIEWTFAAWLALPNDHLEDMTPYDWIKRTSGDNPIADKAQLESALQASLHGWLS